MIKKVNNKSKKSKKSENKYKRSLGEIIVYFIKIETPKQVFFCDFCKILKDTYFEEHLRTAASVSGQNEFRIMPSSTGTGYFRDSFGSISARSRTFAVLHTTLFRLAQPPPIYTWKSLS